VCEFVRAADELGVPRPVSIQNSFCLLHRQFDTEVAEACSKSNYNILLLPWTPLAGGALSGKYLDGARPEGARMSVFKHFHQRYLNENSVKATKQYKEIADKAGMSLTTMALNWCKTRTFDTSTIIGATTLEQLKENIDAFEPSVVLSKETLKAIDAVHQQCRDPCIAV
jgi:aryl-alcohol dehydrogenase-like predicted oxidoreductase